jgi:hypothetical protein
MPKPSSTLPDTQVTPDPALEKRTRRRFSTEYKLDILAKAGMPASMDSWVCYCARRNSIAINYSNGGENSQPAKPMVSAKQIRGQPLQGQRNNVVSNNWRRRTAV